METKKRFEIVRRDCRKHLKAFLPTKSTNTSVGYDFRSSEPVHIEPGAKHMFWTDVKVHLNDDEMLMLVPRISIGIVMNLMLANTIGIIDPDYYGNDDNDGNIGICMFNYGCEMEMIDKGQRFAQGIVVKVVHDADEGNSTKRTGGIGSTGK